MTLVSPGVAEAISDTRTPQGVFCLCARIEGFNGRGHGDIHSPVSGSRCLFRDPVPFVDLFSPKLLRSTMGSVFRQPVFLSSDLPETIRELQKLVLIGLEGGLRLLHQGGEGGGVVDGQLGKHLAVEGNAGLCRRLRSGARARREEGLFWAEGARLCREALSWGPEVRAVLATKEALDQNPWLREAG